MVPVELERPMVRDMGAFAWQVADRREAPFTGSLLLQRALPLREAVADEPRGVLRLTFRRPWTLGRDAALRKVEAVFWSPPDVPAWARPACVLLSWTGGTTAILSVYWVAALGLDGPVYATAITAGGWTFPTGAACAASWLGVYVLRVRLRLLTHDPALRGRHGRAHQERALAGAAEILRRSRRAGG